MKLPVAHNAQSVRLCFRINDLIRLEKQKGFETGMHEQWGVSTNQFFKGF